MMIRSVRTLLVGALLGATSVSAQVPRPLPRSPAPASGEDARPAPGRPGAQAPSAAAQAGQLTDEARQSLAWIKLRNGFELEAGQLAQQRGHSQEVKDLGRELEQEARRVGGELSALLAERGVDANSLDALSGLPSLAAERNTHQQVMARLRELQGEQFDRELVQHVIGVEQQYVENLKGMRDRTPGEDARLKKWLDDTENVAEAHLASARDAKRVLDDQRAARRPPAR